MRLWETVVWDVLQHASWIPLQLSDTRHMAAASVIAMVCSNRKFEDGYQVEVPDNWLKDGNPFEVRRSEYATEVKFGGYVRHCLGERKEKSFRSGGLSVCYGCSV